jgi:predicted RNA-binding protein (TIGR00451 family)
MFRKYHIEKIEQLKSSAQRAIRARIADQYPSLDDDALDALAPKKGAPMVLGKCADKVTVVLVDDTPLFFQHRDGPYFPTLRVLHAYPDMMPKVRVDEGAIKFIMSGANIMCRGLTSDGATIHDELEADEPCAVYAQGKEHALAIGMTKMSTADMRAVNKGIGVDLVCYLNDGLWTSTVPKR